jgi:hypothetical protein
MKNTFIVSFLFMSIFAFGQKLEIGIIANPNYSYRVFKADEDMKLLFGGEKPTIGYELGVFTLIPINENIGIESGMRYSRMGFSFGKISTFNDDGSFHSSFYAQQQYDFLNVPIKAKFKFFKDRKFSLESKIGINNNIFLTEQSKSDGVWYKNESSTVKKYQLGVSAGIGTSTLIGKNFKVYFIPTVNYCPMSLYGNDVRAKRYLYNLGAEFIVTYQFSKR